MDTSPEGQDPAPGPDPAALIARQQELYAAWIAEPDPGVRGELDRAGQSLARRRRQQAVAVDRPPGDTPAGPL